jgi:hypothetical protein
MRDGFAEKFTLSSLRKRLLKKSLSPSNMEKYDVYFIQTFVKETIRLYTSMKESGLAKDVYESSEHINKKIEHVSCFRL